MSSENQTVAGAVRGTSESVAASAARTTVAALKVDRVSKRFMQGSLPVEALQRISLTIEQGEFVAIMGASGSGKSSLLHAVAGLTSIDEGHIAIDGADITSMSDGQLTHFRRRRIGLVFQAYNLIPALTAEENIVLPTLADAPSATRRGELRSDDVSRLIERLGLVERRRHRPDSLSGGEQQRVAIARALITNPAIVLADEPTGSLDSVSGQNICRLLRELCHERQRTIVMVTHEPAVAAWAERIVVMRDGYVLTEFATLGMGNSQTLATHYQEIVNAPA